MFDPRIAIPSNEASLYRENAIVSVHAAAPSCPMEDVPIAAIAAHDDDNVGIDSITQDVVHIHADSKSLSALSCCGSSSGRSSGRGSSSCCDDIVGKCLLCCCPYDDYASQTRCSLCRMLVLVCDNCRNQQTELQITTTSTPLSTPLVETDNQQSSNAGTRNDKKHLQQLCCDLCAKKRCK